MYPGGNIIRVTPTLSEDAYAVGDVVFTATEIPNAVSSRGGVSKLVGIYMLDKSDTADSDITILFSEGNTALGTVNATAGISDADIEAMNMLGFCKLDADQGTTGTTIDNSRLFIVMPATLSGEQTNPTMLLKAAEGSTSVYIHGILTSGTTPTYAADDIIFIFHIEYLG